MEKFEITKEVVEEMQKATQPATPEEIAKRQKPAEDFELMQGDRDKKMHDREEVSQK